MKLLCQMLIAIAFLASGSMFTFMPQVYENAGQNMAMCTGGLATCAWIFGMIILFNLENM